MYRQGFAAAFVGALALVTVATSATEAQPARVQVGTLNCSLSSSVGMLVGSQRNVNCLFRADGAPDEAYTGTLTRVGLDIGVTSGGAIVWAVFASTNRYVGMISGTYAGASAEATVAAGLGANVLVGGSNRSVALQPLSVQGQVGLNIAAGVSALDLHLAR
jgi:hypothetical protein